MKEWLDHYFAGDPIAISFISTARNNFPRAGVAVIARSHMVRPNPLAQVLSVVQPRPWTGCRTQPLTILVPCHRVMGRQLMGYASGLDRERWLYTMKELSEGEINRCIPLLNTQNVRLVERLNQN